MDPTQWWGHGFGFMWLIPLLFVVALIILVRGIFGRGSSGYRSYGDNTMHQESAREMLDKRFAKGEISKKEYEVMKEALEK